MVKVKLVRIAIFFFILFACPQYAFSHRYFKPLKKTKASVDIVYTWVDGEDPTWQQMREDVVKTYQYSICSDSKCSYRFRSRNELKYSLRSVHRFAPFINHIYIVTCGQVPAWLKPHSKITVIDHKAIFRDQKDLPTFNSQAIEANLHHIPRLSECFIYFNDDVFLGRPAKKHKFFAKDGRPKLFKASWYSYKGKSTENDSGFEAAWKNNNAFLDCLFKDKKRFAICHGPLPLRKSHLQQFEHHFPMIFSSVSSHKFRSPADFLITGGLVQYLAFYHKQTKQSKISHLTMSFTPDMEENRKNFQMIETGTKDSFCVQDVVEESNLELDNQFEEFLAHCFPEPAPWEK